MLLKIRSLFLYSWLLMMAGSAAVSAQSSLIYGVNAGEARATATADQVLLENKLFAARWSIRQGRISRADFIEHQFEQQFEQQPEKHFPLSPDLFVLKFSDGVILRSSSMTTQGDPKVESLRAEPDALKSAQRTIRPGCLSMRAFQTRRAV